MAEQTMTVPRRVLPNGHILEVQALTYGRARLHIARHGEPERVGYDDGW